jgi:hypothetical protein
MFENRLLRRIFVPKREKITGGWEKNFVMGSFIIFTSPNVISIIKSRTMMSEEYVAV